MARGREAEDSFREEPHEPSRPVSRILRRRRSTEEPNRWVGEVDTRGGATATISAGAPALAWRFQERWTKPALSARCLARPSRRLSRPLGIHSRLECPERWK